MLKPIKNGKTAKVCNMNARYRKKGVLPSIIHMTLVGKADSKYMPSKRRVKENNFLTVEYDFCLDPQIQYTEINAREKPIKRSKVADHNGNV